MLAMLRYPEVQTKAQLEIDTVVGTGRFPTLKDRPSLPYIGAILKETLRWHPIVPMGQFFNHPARKGTHALL
jgi:cytochrome P450